MKKHEFYKETLNKTGYALTEVLDSFTKKFILFASTANLPVLEIGAAFGVASLAALKAGAIVIVNDLDERHLKVFYEQTPVNLRKNSILIPASFPENISFLNNSISAILCCRVIHFFNPEYVILSIKNCYKWLKKGGKAFFYS